MKFFITTVLTSIFAISMAAFILSFNACVSSQEGVLVDNDRNLPLQESVFDGTNTNVFYFNKGEQMPVYDKAELIVFNADGEVVYNEIIDSI